MNTACRADHVAYVEDRRASDECGHGNWQADRRDRALQGLAGSSVADRFRAWTGRSGRRYVFSVYPLDATGDVLDRIPSEGCSVVIGVERHGGTRHPVFVADSGAVPGAFFQSARVAGLRDSRVGELHVHLTSGDAAQREAVVRDLDLLD